MRAGLLTITAALVMINGAYLVVVSGSTQKAPKPGSPLRESFGGAVRT